MYIEEDAESNDEDDYVELIEVPDLENAFENVSENALENVPDNALENVSENALENVSEIASENVSNDEENYRKKQKVQSKITSFFTNKK